MKTDKQALIDSLAELIELEKSFEPANIPAFLNINPADFDNLDQKTVSELLVALKRFSEKKDTAKVLRKLKEELQADAF